MIKISKHLPLLLAGWAIGVVGLIFYFWINPKTVQINANTPTISENINKVTKLEECHHNPTIEYFMYHYIRETDTRDAPSTRDLSMDPQDFRKHLSYIQQLEKEKKIHLMNGIDFYNSLSTGCFPAKNIWIFTSDDGWSDTYSNLVPIATEYHIPFFIWIIWNNIDKNGFVTASQIQEISKNPLFTIASHSMNHRDQSKITQEEEIKEMCDSKNKIENIIHIPIKSYIYPSGRMSTYSEKIAKECGYQIAWSTGFGEKWNPKNPSKYNINRNRIHSKTSTSLFEAILKKNP